MTAQTSFDAREQVATVDYIGALSEELAGLAEKAGLDLIAYLLDMVRLEADVVKKRLAGEPETG